MRLMASELAEGCRKLTVSWGAILKFDQVSDRSWLYCVMVVVVPELLICPEPDTTLPPPGPACAAIAASHNPAKNSHRAPSPLALCARFGTAIGLSHRSLKIRWRVSIIVLCSLALLT